MDFPQPGFFNFLNCYKNKLITIWFLLFTDFCGNLDWVYVVWLWLAIIFHANYIDLSTTIEYIKYVQDMQYLS